MRRKIIAAIPPLALLAAAATAACSSSFEGGARTSEPSEEIAVQRSADSATVTVSVTTNVAADFADAQGFNDPSQGSTVRFVDINGDGKADVCARRQDEILCRISNGTGWGATVTLAAFNNAGGWSAPAQYTTIRFPDLNGDGKADICGQGPIRGTILCYQSTGSGFGSPTSAILPAVSAGWSSGPQYYSTVQFPDINGDGKADLAVRAAQGVYFSLDNGAGAVGDDVLGPALSDTGGWTDPQYYSTIQYADVTGDGAADLCARTPTGFACYPWTGVSPTGWGAAISGPAWPSTQWNVAEFYSTIQLADINGDKKADVCGRGPNGVECYLATGTGFATTSITIPALTDAGGWGSAVMLYGDVDGDGKADVCARNGNGVQCWISQGTAFPSTPSVLVPAFADQSSWNGALYIPTIQLADVNGDGAKDICGRWPSGGFCAIMTPSAVAGAKACAGFEQYKLETGAESAAKNYSDCPATTPGSSTPLQCYYLATKTTNVISRRQKSMLVDGSCKTYFQHTGQCIVWNQVAVPDPSDTCTVYEAAAVLTTNRANLHAAADRLLAPLPPAGNGSTAGQAAVDAAIDAEYFTTFGWNTSGSWPLCYVTIAQSPVILPGINPACGTYVVAPTYPVSCIVPGTETDSASLTSSYGLSPSQLPPATDPLSVSCTAACPFSPTCPPGMYNKTLVNDPWGGANTGGYTLGDFVASTGGVEPDGCTFTPPASCLTAASNAPMPPFSAPVLTAVALGTNTVYAIGAPASPLSASDFRSAVFAWGTNGYKQLGNGSIADSTAFPQVPIYDPGHPVKQIAAGNADACALLSNVDANGNFLDTDTSVYCWGNISTSPSITWGVASQMKFPAGTQIKQIAHGDQHACALSTAGDVYCWGENRANQLGAILSPTPQNAHNVVPISTAGSLYAGQPLPVDIVDGFVANNGAGSAQVPGTIEAVAASGDSTCVLADGIPTAALPTSIRGVYCWGDNSLGALGNNSGQQGTTSFAAVAVNTPIDQLFSTPMSFVDLLGAGVGSQGVHGSFCGHVQSSDGTTPAYCWGANDQGQLDIFVPNSVPLTANATIFVPTPVDDATVAVSALTIGSEHGCAQAGGFTYCFGNNDDGQLGAAPTPTVLATSQQVVVPTPASFPSASYTSLAAGPNQTCAIYTAPTASKQPSYGAPNAVGNGVCWGAVTSLGTTSFTPVLLPWPGAH
jgi:hypothetical protein